MIGLVLDLETALDRDAAEGARRTGPTACLRAWLHRILAASMLGFAFDPAAQVFSDFRLESALARDPGDEPALLDMVEKRLQLLGEDGLLITFNGRGHDLPMLMRRRLHHWLFAPSATAGFLRAGHRRHEDVMLQLAGASGQRWPALADICAALGIPANPGILTRRRQNPPVEPTLAKGQTDVLATFILHCVSAAATEGSAVVLARGWTALADHLLTEYAGVPWLTQFATSPTALVARERAKTL